MKKAIRRVLDSICANVRSRLKESMAFREGRGDRPLEPLHYAYSPQGYLVSGYLAAVDEERQDAPRLWEEFLSLLDEVAKVYHFKRITDALAELKGGFPFPDGLPGVMQSISDELLAVEFRKPNELKRRKGVSRFAGKLVCEGVFVPEDSSKVKVGEEEYQFTAYNDWCVMDRVLKALSLNETGYVIRLTTAEMNALHDGCKTFFKKYVERQIRPQEARRSNREKWADVARFRYEMLKRRG